MLNPNHYSQGLTFNNLCGQRNIEREGSVTILSLVAKLPPAPPKNFAPRQLFATSTFPVTHLIIRSKFLFLFIGREPAAWPANNCLQIMVCSCAMPSNCVWPQIIFCTYVKETVLFSFLRSLLRENGRSLRFPRMFIKKTNSVIEW